MEKWIPPVATLRPGGDARPSITRCSTASSLLAGLLRESSSDVGIFLHHESSVGRTQVEDQAAGYVIHAHGDAAVRTDLIVTISCECRRMPDGCGRIERVCCL